ncbi:MAG: methyltransferase [Chitinophagaceae bacterium]|nr:methyltransferase [Chitinophagaceae bacterium]
MNFFSKDKHSAFGSKEKAQWIAFGPVIFQVARVLRNSGILQLIDDSGRAGLTQDDIISKTGMSEYGVRILLESGLGMGLVLVNDKKYSLGKTGYFMLHDELTRINMDFIHDVNYRGLFSLNESIEQGKPVGLKEFGDWDTIYEGLSKLPTHVQKSWFDFDHFYSDDAFPLVLPMIYDGGAKKILDIGGNTGKWAIASANYSPDVHITIMDLPGQLNVARNRITELCLDERISFLPVNILDEKAVIPKGYDTIWMSQFLDCFSEKEIVSILKRCYDALDENGQVAIMEPFWDRQRFEVSAFCLQQISVYFTALANGNSQMYSLSTFMTCIEQAGFEVVEQTDHIGVSQTLLKCKKRK